jgi:hypothetical protein
MSETGISVVPFQESQLQSLLKMSVFRQARILPMPQMPENKWGFSP